MEKLIHRQMTIDEILSSFPHRSQKLAQEMLSKGLHCVGCGASTWETLEAGMFGHGFADEDVDHMVEKLNAIASEPIDTTTITLTLRAAEKFQQISAAEGVPGSALRFDDHPGGCSGYEYILDFSPAAEEDDVVFFSHGVEIHVRKSAVSRLVGSEIDYIDGLQGAGFKISNPNAKSSCGCGKSQGY